MRIIGPTGETSVLGLLDTGADMTILPTFVASQLGVLTDPIEKSLFRGVGNQLVPVMHATVELEIGKRPRCYRWSAKVGVLDGRSTAILGHTGFLEHFRAVFDGQRREVTLQPTVNLRSENRM